MDWREFELGRVASAVTFDEALLRAIAFSERHGFPVPITVLLGGTLITGVIGRPSEHAAQLDAQIQQLVERIEARVPEEAREAWGTLRDAVAADTFVDQERDARNELSKAIEDVESVDDLATDALYAFAASLTPAAFSIETATVIHPGRTKPLEVKTVRVQTGSVDAWWVPASLQQEGSGSGEQAASSATPESSGDAPSA